MTRPGSAYRKLKALNVSEWTPIFWLVKRKALVHREAGYSVLRANIDTKLARRLRGYVKQQLQTRDFKVHAYDFNNADTDDVLLTLETGATDFPKIEAEIVRGFDNALVQQYEELLGSWAYVVQFKKGDDSLYAWRKIGGATDPKKIISKGATFFSDHKLVDIDDKEIFLIDTRFDFFVFDGVTFIADKRQFENSMNFREGMKARRDELLDELAGLKFLSDVAVIRDHVGDNLHHLRKLAAIHKAKYFHQPGYVAKLIATCRKEGWGLKLNGSTIVVEPDTIDLLLTLLNNSRLRSPINNELFDAAVKQPVQTSAA